MAITNASRLADFGSGIGTDGSVLELDNAQQRVGIGTTNPQSTLQVGIAITMDGTAGVITAANFVGGGANLTALNGTAIASGTVAAARVATLNQNTTGTAGGLSGTPDITVQNITGVAATFTGAVTYEDVTNVDSVGVVTARGGLEVGAAGVGATITSAGNAIISGFSTFKNDVHLTGSAGVSSVTWDASANALIFNDSMTANFGDSSDLQIYHQDSINYLKSTNASAPIQLQAPAGEVLGKFTPNGSVDLYYNGSKKFETTETGTITTGISTADGFSVGDNEYITVGVGSDLAIYHDSSNSYIADNGTGDLRLRGSKVVIQNAGGTASVLESDGTGIELYYNNSKKLNTLSTGVKVTGVTSTTSLSVGPGVLQEKLYNVASALTGTVNFDVVDNGLVQYYTTNSSGTFVVNLRGDGSTTFNSLMDIGKSTVFTLYSAQNNASYYMTDFQIDGSSITEKWNGGSAPSAGTASGTDVYTFNIMKTADATFTVFATFSNFA